MSDDAKVQAAQIQRGWIGVDLDGTLAEWTDGHFTAGKIGDPVPLMADRVRAWLAAGEEIRIFTARVSHTDQSPDEVERNRTIIEMWTEKHFGVKLKVTCQKDYLMKALWDDVCIQIEKNTGRRVDGKEES